MLKPKGAYFFRILRSFKIRTLRARNGGLSSYFDSSNLVLTDNCNDGVVKREGRAAVSQNRIMW